MEPAIREFFENFQKYNDAGDTEGLARLYSPIFMVATPGGVQPVQAADMLKIIPKRKQMLEEVGCKSTTLVDLQETKLDPTYTLVQTTWKWLFHRGGESKEFTLTSTSILRATTEGPQIVFYLNHEDIMAALRKDGLLPPS